MGYFRLPPLNIDLIKKNEYFLLFETAFFDKDNFRSYIFFNPFKVIKINSYEELKEAFEMIENYAKRYYLAGYFAYELGYYFEKDLFKPKPVSSYPLIHLCVFDEVISFDHRTAKLNKKLPNIFKKTYKEEDFLIKNLRIGIKKRDYVRKIKRIKQYIKKGDTYQVNFTTKFYFDFWGCPFSFYNDLKNRQNVSYAGFCKFKDNYIISLSPELFFKRQARKIYSKPMKGTIQRGFNIYEDKLKAFSLKESQKDRAENLMIVDLIRNDLGRISEIGSIKVSKLFNIERYNTLFQMTSTVEGRLKKQITYFDIFKSIFPGGSVTGAPKLRTMQIIKELEASPRNVYCGALGIIFPKKKAIFNLPIRTILINKHKAEMGVGGGIVIDSSADKEYKECLLKARFLTERYMPFRLIESILWDKKYSFLKQHLKRLKDSAEYFDFKFDYVKIIKALKKVQQDFVLHHKYKVRVLLDKEGDLNIDYLDITYDFLDKEKYVAISKHRIDPENIFLYHKTTNRFLYDREYAYYRKKDYFEVIFLNKYGQVTEGAISNVVIKKEDNYYTPSISSGLLPGIFRQYLIKNYNVKEKVIYLKDLIEADKIFVCNSVRGITEVKLKK